MALFQDAFTISPARTGNAILKNLVLTGYTNSETNTEDGRLYWKVTEDEDLELYRDELYTELVAFGDIVDGVVEIEDADEFGITGSAVVVFDVGEESTGEVILTYAREEDMLIYERDLLDFLDAETFLGEVRFEAVSRAAKEKLDKMLRNKLRAYFRRKGNGEVDLSCIAKPRQLAPVHARFMLYLIFTAVNNGDRDIMQLAKDHLREGEKELDLLNIELDFDNDDNVDASPPTSGSRLTR
jgi:hypothetical protein